MQNSKRCQGQSKVPGAIESARAIQSARASSGDQEPIQGARTDPRCWGQSTMPGRTFCVEWRTLSADISHLRSFVSGNLEISFLGQNVNLNVQVTAVATAKTSQQLSPSGQTPDLRRTGMKYPIQGIPHFDEKAEAEADRSEGFAYI